MPGTLQPLDQKFAIVDAKGQPTEYFIRWAQQKQIDIGESITLAQAEELLASRQIVAGRALDGGGFLSGDVTIDHAESLVVPGTYGDATHVPQFVVDQEGHIQGVVLVAISGGGGGVYSKVNFPIDVPPTVPNAFDDEFPGAALGGAWSWVNQGPTLGQTASATVKNGLLRLGVDLIPNANQNTHLVVKTIPAGDFDIITKCRISGISTNYQSAGLALYSSVSGKLTENKFMYRSPGINFVGYADWTSPTGGVPSENNFQVSAPFWYVRWRNVGGNLTAYSSPDGFEWSIVRTQTLAGGFVANPTHVGLLIDTENTTWKSQSIYYWIRNYGAAGYVEP